MTTIEDRMNKIFPIINEFRVARRSIAPHEDSTKAIVCPLCGGTFTIDYSGSFGTVNAKCSTKDCVIWDE